jgi:hypothetical protein
MKATNSYASFPPLPLPVPPDADVGAGSGPPLPLPVRFPVVDPEDRSSSAYGSSLPVELEPAVALLLDDDPAAVPFPVVVVVVLLAVVEFDEALTSCRAPADPGGSGTTTSASCLVATANGTTATPRKRTTSIQTTEGGGCHPPTFPRWQRRRSSRQKHRSGREMDFVCFIFGAIRFNPEATQRVVGCFAFRRHSLARSLVG